MESAVAHEHKIGARLNIFFNQFGASYSPDGKRILSIGYRIFADEALVFWNSASGSRELELVFERGQFSIEIASARFSYDGTHAIVLADEANEYDDGIRVLNAVSGDQLFHLGRGQRFCQFDLSSAGSLLLAVGYDWKTIQIWNYKTGEHILSKEFDPGGYPSAKFRRDGQRFFLAHEDMRPVIVSDVAKGDEALRLEGGYWDGAFSPDGTQIILWSEKADLWDANSGKKILELGEATAAGFSPDGKYIFTASFQDNSLNIWGATSGEKLHVLDAFRNEEWYANWERGLPAFSPDGRYIASCEEDQAMIRLLETGEVVSQLKRSDCVVSSVEFRPDGKQILVTAWTEHKDHRHGEMLYSGHAPFTFIWDLV